MILVQILIRWFLLISSQRNFWKENCQRIHFDGFQFLLPFFKWLDIEKNDRYFNRGETKSRANKGGRRSIHFVSRHLSARIYFSKARLENNPASSPKLKSINTIPPSCIFIGGVPEQISTITGMPDWTYNEIFTSRLRDCDEITPCFSTTRFPSPTHTDSIESLNSSNFHPRIINASLYARISLPDLDEPVCRVFFFLFFFSSCKKFLETIDSESFWKLNQHWMFLPKEWDDNRSIIL